MNFVQIQPDGRTMRSTTRTAGASARPIPRGAPSCTRDTPSDCVRAAAGTSAGAIVRHPRGAPQSPHVSPVGSTTKSCADVAPPPAAAGARRRATSNAITSAPCSPTFAPYKRSA